MSLQTLDRIRHVRTRRDALRTQLDAWKDFELWEETCVPSYVHPNRAAAGVAWWRLFAAVDLADRHVRWGRVLDFGASVGELARILPDGAGPYEFIEMEEAPARYLEESMPGSVRTTLEDAPEGAYSVVFALDSLEHNTNFEELLGLLATRLASDGVLILSGPTESALYRLGRKISGFDAHYHETNIYAIEAAARRILAPVEIRAVPTRIAPLFRVSAWRRR